MRDSIPVETRKASSSLDHIRTHSNINRTTAAQPHSSTSNTTSTYCTHHSTTIRNNNWMNMSSIQTERENSNAMADLERQQAEDVAAAAAAALAVPSRHKPKPLPAGWVLRAARSQPHHYFYYHQETGVASWEAPFLTHETIQDSVKDEPMEDVKVEMEPETREMDKNRKKRRSSLDSAASAPNDTNQGRSKPTKVRVLHILKKHTDSRKPTSWRLPNGVTATRDEARAELQSLLELLRETQSDPEELRATMEELARTESDCSSYKRGGDLGFFETKKMQPAFEHAAFNMEIGDLSHDLVETSSGLHILLRIG